MLKLGLLVLFKIKNAYFYSKDTPPEPESALPNVVGGAYVPPNRRGAGAAESAPRAQQARPQPRRNRNAPDITSEVFFPSLSAAGDDSGPKGAWGNRAAAKRDEGAFQEVMERSNQGYASRQSDAPRLVTTNKFDALREWKGARRRLSQMSPCQSANQFTCIACTGWNVFFLPRTFVL